MNHSLKIKLLVPFTAWLALTIGMPASSASFDHELYDKLLKAHVADGLVDYKALKEDARLDQYLAQLNEADLDSLKSRDEKVAFWTNAYNAYTLKLITHHYPVASIMDIKKSGYPDAWKFPWAKIGGKTYTLDQVENEIIRPRWPDPRIHYALVCAAQSCPQLRNEAYIADRLDEQFNDQAKWFMIHRNSFDLRTRTAKLSKVYEWYAVDFGDNQADMLRTLIPHVPQELAQSFKKNAKKWNVEFVEWDWNLNEQN